jgi:hypothetical protein
VALTAGVHRATRPPPETILWTKSHNNPLASSGDLGGKLLPTARGFVVRSVGVRIVTGSGGGAGNTVLRITDGTNNCDATLACSVSQAAGTYRSDQTASFALSGACVFAAGAAVRATVQTAGCTTTQPTAVNFDVMGDWQ